MRGEWKNHTFTDSSQKGMEEVSGGGGGVGTSYRELRTRSAEKPCRSNQLGARRRGSEGVRAKARGTR